jgi:hypothetical protein
MRTNARSSTTKTQNEIRKNSTIRNTKVNKENKKARSQQKEFHIQNTKLTMTSSRYDHNKNNFI